MTTVLAIEAIANWLNERVCPKLLFKRANDLHQDDSYPFEEVHPKAYAMFYPDGMMPEEEKGRPFILVTPAKGNRKVIQKTDRMSVQLTFRTWNPGTHKEENAEGAPYRKNTDGWKDVWNLLDWTLREIENVQYLNGLRFVASEGVEYGPMVKDGQFVDEYPYFSAYATITVEWPIVRTEEPFAEML